ncbi:MAG TPA: (deoxy)nucleoside triphosphate pyrophosphohydrolase [Myxococcaceae bacterium]|nr:(deoxy)nucleoside triphosphate pyrophosphohydrolase [Myxococcaceae bacterium]
MSTPKTVRVVAALIADDSQPPRYLVQQRLPDESRPLLWEFPGGKVEPGESDARALIRECQEELGVALEVGEPLWQTSHAYVDLRVHLAVYRAWIREGQPRPLHAHALRWASGKQMREMPFCEADLPLVESLAAGAL